MPNTYSIDAFVKQVIECGYVERSYKKQIYDWCEKHPKEQYTDDDMQDCYRYFENRRLGVGYSCGKWHVGFDGHKTTKHYQSDIGNR